MREANPHSIRSLSVGVVGFALLALGAVWAGNRAVVRYGELSGAKEAIDVLQKSEGAWSEDDVANSKFAAYVRQREGWHKLEESAGASIRLELKGAPTMRPGRLLSEIQRDTHGDVDAPPFTGDYVTKLGHDLEKLVRIVNPPPELEFKVTITRTPADSTNPKQIWWLELAAIPSKGDRSRFAVAIRDRDHSTLECGWTPQGRTDVRRAIPDQPVPWTAVWLATPPDPSGPLAASEPLWLNGLQKKAWIWNEVREHDSAGALQQLEALRSREDRVLRAIEITGYALPVFALLFIVMLLRQATMLVARVRSWSDRIEESLSGASAWCWLAVVAACVTGALPVAMALTTQKIRSTIPSPTTWTTAAAVVLVFASALAWMNLRLRSVLRSNRRES